MDGQRLIFEVMNLANFHDTGREGEKEDGGGGERKTISNVHSRLLIFGKIPQDRLSIE